MKIKEIMLKMRDRVRLQNFIYFPVGEGPFPTLLALVRNSTTLTMARLGMDIWIYILYIIIALFSEGFILTESQTISAVHTYSQIKAKEEEECIVFANIDLYLKNIPEDLIRSIDDDDLTLIWIGLQRTTS